MKNLLVLTLLCLCALPGYSQQSNVNTHGLSQADFDAINKAVELVDKGLADLALQDFDRILAANPDNYLAQYERLYALYKTGRTADAMKDYKKFLKHPDVTELAYHLIGQILKSEGRMKEREKVINEGLKHFPNSGLLYMIAGIDALQSHDFEKGLHYLNTGIKQDPMFMKNYYCAAQTMFQMKDFKTWALVYAETAMLLNNVDPELSADLASMIRKCYLNSISITPDSTSVSLTPARALIEIENKETKKQKDVLTKTNTILAFPGVYEGCTDLAVKQMSQTDKSFTASIDQLSRLRKNILENYYNITDNLYGDMMYLFPFQKKVLDAGYWEAYNYYLFGSLFPQEFEAWIKEHKASIDEFYRWYTNGQFVLDSEHSVCLLTAYNHTTMYTAIGALSLEAELLGEHPQTVDDLFKMLKESKTLFDLEKWNTDK